MKYIMKNCRMNGQSKERGYHNCLCYHNASNINEIMVVHIKHEAAYQIIISIHEKNVLYMQHRKFI